MSITQEQREMCEFLIQNRDVLDSLINETANDLKERAVEIVKDEKGYHFTKTRIGGNWGVTINQNMKTLFHTHPPYDRKYHEPIDPGFSPKDIRAAMISEATIFCLGEKIDGENVITCRLGDPKLQKEILNGPWKNWYADELFEAVTRTCECSGCDPKTGRLPPAMKKK